ncbi:hypothetical protein Nos7524_5257 [Nostoc sp. PCC 7524]|nr:hypothetical protein Nos7524_5257 [Nostoc sp. PCC 7524]
MYHLRKYLQNLPLFINKKSTNANINIGRKLSSLLAIYLRNIVFPLHINIRLNLVYQGFRKNYLLNLVI